MAAHRRPVNMHVFRSCRPSFCLGQKPGYGFHGEGELVCNLAGAVPFGQQEFRPGYQIVKGRHAKRFVVIYLSFRLIFEPQTGQSPSVLK